MYDTHYMKLAYNFCNGMNPLQIHTMKAKNIVGIFISYSSESISCGIMFPKEAKNQKLWPESQ